MGDKIECVCEELEEIDSFDSLLEFKKFLNYHNDLLMSGDLVEVPVEEHFSSNPLLAERWFKCIRCSQIWRLIYPDPPFMGLWKRVT